MKRIFLGLLLLSSVCFAETINRTFVLNGIPYNINAHIYEDIYEYDINGNLIHEEEEILGYEHWYEYDEKGNLIYEKRIGGYKSDTWEAWYDYDIKGNLIHEKFTSGYEYWYEYDEKGHKIYEKCENDSYSLETWNEYDVEGTLTYSINSYGGETRYEYDEKGNLIYEQDSSGNECWCEYDESGNIVHWKMPFEEEFWYKYDIEGNLIYEKDFDGDETWYDYEENGILFHKLRIYSDHESEYFYEYEYDEFGHITKKITYSIIEKYDSSIIEEEQNITPKNPLLTKESINIHGIDLNSSPKDILYSFPAARILYNNKFDETYTKKYLVDDIEGFSYIEFTFSDNDLIKILKYQYGSYGHITEIGHLVEKSYNELQALYGYPEIEEHYDYRLFRWSGEDISIELKYNYYMDYEYGYISSNSCSIEYIY